MKNIIKEVYEQPQKIMFGLQKLKLLRWMSDETYIKITYKLAFNKKLDLSNPKTFNQKLQWLKLNSRKSEYTQMVDKYGVREYVSKKIGDQYLIPLLGVWNKFEEIDFDDLPNQFVLKCTHDSGGIVICKDKSKLDIKAAQKKINKCLKQNFYYKGREWPYKNVKPRIIAEKYMTDKSDCDSLTDYKFFCFNGYVDNVMVCVDREIGDPKFYFFDEKWNLLRLNILGSQVPENFTLPKPECIDEMFKLASTLSQGIPFLRVDLYAIENKIYFGELTFYPQNGYDNKLLPETDELLGNMINLK